MNEYRRSPGPPGAGPRSPQRGSAPPRQSFTKPSDAELRAIVIDGKAELLVKSAETLGEELKNQGLTTSQIRGIFGTMRQIQMRWPPRPSEAENNSALRQLRLLKPKLAYQASRATGQGMSNLQEVLVPAIDLVTTRQHFTHLMDYLEAILAYHKAKGGQ